MGFRRTEGGGREGGRGRDYHIHSTLRFRPECPNDCSVKESENKGFKGHVTEKWGAGGVEGERQGRSPNSNG